MKFRIQTVLRGLLTSSVVALALGGCSVSFGSSPSSYPAGAGKPMPSNYNYDYVDDREKPLPASARNDVTKPELEKPHRKPVAEPAEPTRDEPAKPPERIKKKKPARMPIPKDDGGKVEEDPRAKPRLERKPRPTTEPDDGKVEKPTRTKPRLERKPTTEPKDEVEKPARLDPQLTRRPMRKPQPKLFSRAGERTVIRTTR